MPKRPLIAVLLTTAALALLLSFKTPVCCPDRRFERRGGTAA
jgi:hypothetical protein